MDKSNRIVSLIASATEIVCALDLRDRLVGRSHECDFPADVASLPVLSEPKVDPNLPGGTIDRQVREIVRDGLSVYRIKVDELAALDPDLIVTQDHCEVCAVSLNDVEDALCQAVGVTASICTLHPNDLADVRRDFRTVAAAAGVPRRGEDLVTAFDRRLAAVADRTRNLPKRRVALIEWYEPPMIAGGWMPELATIAGGDPIIVDSPRSFATVTWEQIAGEDPDVVLLLPCGYSVERSFSELASPPLREAIEGIGAASRGAVYVTDGNQLFNRPSPRLADTAELMAGLLHPDACADLRERHRAAFREWGQPTGSGRA